MRSPAFTIGRPTAAERRAGHKKKYSALRCRRKKEQDRRPDVRVAVLFIKMALLTCGHAAG